MASKERNGRACAGQAKEHKLADGGVMNIFLVWCGERTEANWRRPQRGVSLLLYRTTLDQPSAARGSFLAHSDDRTRYSNAMRLLLSCPPDPSNFPVWRYCCLRRIVGINRPSRLPQGVMSSDEAVRSIIRGTGNLWIASEQPYCNRDHIGRISVPMMMTLASLRNTVCWDITKLIYECSV